MEKTEKQIEAKLVAEVKKLGGRAYKFLSPGNSGMPDRIVVLPGGQIAFVELKRTGAKATALQNLQIKRLMSMGCNCFVVDSYEAVDRFTKMYKKEVIL